MRRVGDRGAPPTPLTHLSAEAVEPLHYLVRRKSWTPPRRAAAHSHSGSSYSSADFTPAEPRAAARWPPRAPGGGPRAPPCFLFSVFARSLTGFARPGPALTNTPTPLCHALRELLGSLVAVCVAAQTN